MAIKLKSLERIASTYTEKGYIYNDLSLDIAEKNIVSSGYETSVVGSDIKDSKDAAAIRNSLQNLFNTLPGQRFLFPEYGLNLQRYLFMPITPTTGETISRTILQGIERFEPRVRVAGINVIPDIETSTYNITLVLQLPAFKQVVKFTGLLNIKSQSFIFLPTTKTK
jgi:phage baseplate assembly protein W